LRWWSTWWLHWWSRWWLVWWLCRWSTLIWPNQTSMVRFSDQWSNFRTNQWSNISSTGLIRLGKVWLGQGRLSWWSRRLG
jgi:hypothetical protein